MSLPIGVLKSGPDDWTTPQDVFDSLNAEFGPFDLDPCASEGDAKCPAYFTKEEGGLRTWFGRVFMNPPYGRHLGRWIERAVTAVEGKEAEIVVALLPSRTDTEWWRTCLRTASEIRFIRGRLRFSGLKVNAPFPSVVVVWRAPVSLGGRSEKK